MKAKEICDSYLIISVSLEVGLFLDDSLRELKRQRGQEKGMESGSCTGKAWGFRDTKNLFTISRKEANDIDYSWYSS